VFAFQKPSPGPHYAFMTESPIWLTARGPGISGFSAADSGTGKCFPACFLKRMSLPAAPGRVITVSRP